MRERSYSIFPVLVSAILFASPWLVCGQVVGDYSEWNVLYGHAGFENAASMAPRAFGKVIQSNIAEREKIIAALKTPDEFQKYRAATLAKLRSALGRFPARTPLNARTVGKLERDGYGIEKVIFESRPGYYVTANAYVPKGQNPPFPAVLCPVGHWGQGKAFEDYQRLGIYLARRGFLVLVYDLPGQGERLQYYDPVVGRSIVDPATSEYYVTIEHGVAAGPSYLATGNFASFSVWDGLRALDYLCQRQDVDRERIACTGTSGGGLQTELLSALDERIKVSIPVSHGGCAADDPSDQELAMADVDAAIAPRPLLLIEATGDSISSVLSKKKRHDVVAGVYNLLGASNRTSFVIVDARHGYLEGARKAAYTWLSRWLRSETPSAESLRESRTEIESESTLACTTTGQVKTALGGESLLSLNRAAVRNSNRAALPNRREDWPQWRKRLLDEVKSYIKLPSQPSPLNPQVLSRDDKGSYTLEKVVYYSDPGILIPSLLFLTKTPGPRPAVVFINDGGKSADGAPEDYLRPLAEAGYVVLAIDPRGMGETQPRTSWPYNQRNYRGFTEDSEVDLFYDALRTGTTLVGLRTRDVLAGIDYLETRKEVDGGRIGAIGRGMGGLLALFAAAADERIHSVACDRTLTSYSAVLDSELYSIRFSAFVPGVLRVFDLPDVAALVAPRPLLLLNSVDQRDRRLSVNQVIEAYGKTRSAYRMLGAEDNLRLEEAMSAEQARGKFVTHLTR